MFLIDRILQLKKRDTGAGFLYDGLKVSPFFTIGHRERGSIHSPCFIVKLSVGRFKAFLDMMIYYRQIICRGIQDFF